MPAIVIDCGFCHRKLRVPEDLHGKPVKCQTCQASFTASVPTGEAAASPPGPQAELSPAPSPPPPQEATTPAATPPESAAQEAPVEAELVCPVCGTPNPMNARQCRSCGEAFAEAEDDRPWDRPPAYRGG